MNIKYIIYFLAFATAQLHASDKSRRELINNGHDERNPQVVAIYRGCSSLLHQEPSKFSDLATKKTERQSYIEAQQIVQSFQPFTHLEYDCPFQVVNNGRSYSCQSPIISAVSQYVAHYDRFLNILANCNLEAFGFTGDLQNKNKCPLISYTTKIGTAMKYGTGIANPKFENIRELPYYDEHGIPSETKIGSIMVALIPMNIINDHNRFLYVDVKNEKRLHLGRSKQRRLEQEEICVIGGLPSIVEYKTIDISLPDFSKSWEQDGVDSAHRKVDKHGLTKREYNGWQRRAQNLDDKPKDRAKLYKGIVNRKSADIGMSYIIGKALSDYNLIDNHGVFSSIFCSSH